MKRRSPREAPRCGVRSAGKVPRSPKVEGERNIAAGVKYKIFAYIKVYGVSCTHSAHSLTD